MGVEFLKIKESEEAKEIIQEKFDECWRQLRSQWRESKKA